MNATQQQVLEYVNESFLNLQETKGPFWILRKSNKEFISQNKTNSDVEESAAALENSIINSNKFSGVTAFKIEVVKNINDSKPFSFDIKLPKEETAGVSGIGNNISGDNSVFGMLLNQKDENANLQVNTILEMHKLQTENEVLKAQQKSTAEEVKEFILGVLETPTIKGIANILTTKATNKYFAPASQTAVIATMTGDSDEPKIKKSMGRDFNKINNAVDTLAEFTENPEQVLEQLANYIKTNPDQAKTGLGFIGIQL